jgi:hypothetical protein
MNRMPLTVLYAFTADNAVPVVVYHERVSEHGTALLVNDSGVAGMVRTTVQAEMPV